MEGLKGKRDGRRGRKKVKVSYFIPCRRKRRGKLGKEEEGRKRNRGQGRTVRKERLRVPGRGGRTSRDDEEHGRVEDKGVREGREGWEGEGRRGNGGKGEVRERSLHHLLHLR